jgi:hypothetical protein
MLWEQNSKMCPLLFQWELIMRCSLPVCGWEIYFNNGGEFSIVNTACLVASEVCVRQRCDVSLDVWEVREGTLNIVLFHNQECGTVEETEYKIKTLNRWTHTLVGERSACLCYNNENSQEEPKATCVPGKHCATALVIRIMTEMLNVSVSYRRGVSCWRIYLPTLRAMCDNI